MADEPAQDKGQNQTDSLIDEALRAILTDAAGSSESSGQGKSSATALLETAALATTLANSKMSVLERFLIAEALGSAMADALAPALAEQLIPRLMKFQENGEAGQPSKGQGRSGSTNGSAGTSSSARKSDK
jgi:hypothetical protein